jgi:DNA invertase Pin-like site-specific DNA recombinase
MHKRPFVKAQQTLLGYARVSKGDQQNNALQAKVLKAAGCQRVFEEAASGGRWDRPELHRMLDQLREGDTVVVWKLDRLSRSLKDVLHIMEKIDAARAGFRSVTENIDTTTAPGRMMMQMVGSFAEFEREMIRERTYAGIVAARAEGRIGGPPSKTESRQTPRNCPERRLRPQVRSGNGSSLRHQPAHGLAHRLRVSGQERTMTAGDNGNGYISGVRVVSDVRDELHQRAIPRAP